MVTSWVVAPVEHSLHLLQQLRCESEKGRNDHLYSHTHCSPIFILHRIITMVWNYDKATNSNLPTLESLWIKSIKG